MIACDMGWPEAFTLAVFLVFLASFAWLTAWWSQR